MAFRPYKPTDLSQQLRAATGAGRDGMGFSSHLDARGVGSAGGRGLGHSSYPGPKTAPTAALTVGLKTFMQMYKPAVIVPGGSKPSASALPQRDPISIHYKFEESIGSGTFSEIFRAKSISHGEVAIKAVAPDFHALAAREYVLLRHLQWKCAKGKSVFLRILDAFHSDVGVCLVMDVYPHTLLDLIYQEPVAPFSLSHSGGGNAGEIVVPRFVSTVAESVRAASMGSVDFQKLRRIALDLASALSVLRSEGILHCDIKPENLFIYSRLWRGSRPIAATTDTKGKSLLSWSQIPDDFIIKLGDFGSSCLTSESSSHFTEFAVQSLPYRCPEVLMGVPFNHLIDAWSVGVVLAELCTGNVLFKANTPTELYVQLCMTLCPPPLLRFAGGKFTQNFVDIFPSSHDASAPSLLRAVMELLRDVPSVPSAFPYLVAGLLNPDPDVRLGPSDMLQHPFVVEALNVPLSVLGLKQPSRLAEINSSINAIRGKRKRSVLGESV